MTLEELIANPTVYNFERWCADWHTRKYGRVAINAPKTFAKIAEEFGELAEAWNAAGPDVPDAAEKLAIEAADMVIVLFHFVRGSGVSLADALVKKASVIERRLTDPEFGREKA
jgi:NTP pyrophosphatase (non-canonical NTP hydrolase)